jgi:hypothetical protein
MSASENFGSLWGSAFYIGVMAAVYAVPVIAGFIGGWIEARDRNLKTALMLWTVFLFAPNWLLFLSDPLNSKYYHGPPPYTTFTIISMTFPFAVPVWLVGLFIVYLIRCSVPEPKQQAEEKPVEAKRALAVSVF